MPRPKRRRPKRRAQREASVWDLYQLLTGRGLHLRLEHWPGPLTREELRALWFERRDELLSCWAGRRPWPPEFARFRMAEVVEELGVPWAVEQFEDEPGDDIDDEVLPWEA